MNDIKQHSVIKSIFLHLLPGIFVLVSIFIFSTPAITGLLGFDIRLKPVIGYLFGILVGLIPIQLGILLIEGKKESGKYSIKEIIRYTDKSQLKDYLLYVPANILIFLVFFVVLAPLIQPYIVRTLFSWWPEQYNFQLILQDPISLADYKGIKILVLMYILLSGIFGPLVEELYFRGYLLPRMDEYSGKWAPFINTILFSLYHFFSPWENLIRIIASYPMIYLVWKKRNIRFSIFVHIFVNTLGGIVMLFVIL